MYHEAAKNLDQTGKQPEVTPTNTREKNSLTPTFTSYPVCGQQPNVGCQ